LKGYRSEDAFRITHLLTTAQLQFILLHELGHLVQWEQGHDLGEDTRSNSGSDAHLAEEQRPRAFAL
jgi:hypothetical protein